MQMKLRGHFILDHYRAGKLLRKHIFSNGIVNDGIDKLLDVMFHGTTPISPWYIGLIGSTSYSALAVGDTMASHAGWVENQDYDEATRPAWVEAPASGQEISSYDLAEFTMSATKTIKGCFITSDNTKGGTAGTLWATGLFTNGDVDVVDDDVLKVRYTVSWDA